MTLKKLPRYLCFFLAFQFFFLSTLTGRPQDTNQDSRTARPKETGNSENERKAKELLNLSYQQNFENHTLALHSAQQALELYQTLDDKVGMARAYAQTGRCYMAQSDLPEATQEYEKALQIWRERDNASERAGILIMLGFIEDRKGNWQEAITLLLQAQDLIKEKDEPYMLGQIASGLADVFNESGSPEEGLVQYQRALDYYHLTPDTRDDTVITWRLGHTYTLLGRYSEALASFQQALASVSPDSIDAAQFRDSLGRLYSAINDQAAARQHLQFALDFYEKSNNPIEAAEIRALLGQIYQQQGQFSRARHNYLQALTTFVKLSDKLNQAAIYYALGRLEIKQNNYDAAKGYLQKSIEVTERTRTVSTSGDLATAFAATVHDRYETYIECLMHEHYANPAEHLDVRAFEMSELTRGRSLAELLRGTQTNVVPGLDPQLAEREKSLRQTLRVKEDYKVTLLATQYTQQELSALESELTRLEVEYKQVNDTIKARYPSYSEINQPTGWNLRQIQEQVVADDQTVLLEYSLGSDKSYVWVVTRNDVQSYELPAQAQINEAAQKVYQLLAATERKGDTESELSGAVRELSRMVLSPVAGQLNKQRVIVVADGSLNYIPFQILSGQSGSDEPFVATAEIVNAPSASILGQLRAEAGRRQTPTNLLAAFGDPVFESNYAQRKETGAGEYVASAQTVGGEQWQHALRDIEPAGDTFDPSRLRQLFYSKLELANLRAVAGPESFVATGFDATREKLASVDLTKYAILHFATHGVLDPKRPERSGLFLSMVDRDGRAQNGFVGLQDIYGLHAPVDLVVLSACRTGLGKDVRGEGLIGLTRGFMYAGASSVMASLWKVDDEATSELMKRFYVNLLQKGMTPAAALRAAQNSIRSEPQWRSPYFWAAFTLQGEYRQVIHPPAASSLSRVRPLTIALLSLLLLAGGAWLVWLRRRNLKAA